MVANENTELRKLRPAEFYNFARILSPSDNWKKLIGVIAKEGGGNILKFDGETIAIVEEAARHERKSPAAIFLEEWATMGRERPTLGRLLDVLMKAELFRAVDYLAEEILKIEAPARPAVGPAVPIDAEEALNEALRRLRLKGREASETLKRDSGVTTAEINCKNMKYRMRESEISDSDNNNYEVGVIELRYDQPKSDQVLDRARRYGGSSSKDIYDPTRKSLDESNISDLIKFSDASTGNGECRFGSQCRTDGDLIAFESSEIDEIEDNANLPDFDRLRDTDDDRKSNGDPLTMREMSSTELPAVLKEFQIPGYFNREVTSSELPVCINEITGCSSTESVTNSRSSDDSFLFTNDGSLRSIEDERDDDDDVRRGEQNSALDEGILGVGATGQEMTEQNRDNERIDKCKILNRVFDSQEFPVTVLEFQQH